MENKLKRCRNYHFNAIHRDDLVTNNFHIRLTNLQKNMKRYHIEKDNNKEQFPSFFRL